MPITALPTPPSRADSENFAQRADAFLGALPDFATEANAVADEVNANAAICQSAAMVVSVSAWVSGATYAAGVAVYDPSDFLTYRRKVAGTGATRPGLDAANWQLLTGFGNVTLETNQTITGVKTFTQTIQGSVSGNAATATTAANLSRSVTGAGLATGGGVLVADRTITVTAATQAQAEAGTDNATAMTPLRTEQHMRANALGCAQAWVDVTGSRAHSTIYQNTTGKPIGVFVYGDAFAESRNAEVSVDGVGGWVPVFRFREDSTFFSGGSWIVPNGHYYRIDGQVSFSIWSELR